MKIVLPVLLLALLFSCAGLSGGISGDDIDADMPSAYTGTAKFRIKEHNLLAFFTIQLYSNSYGNKF